MTYPSFDELRKEEQDQAAQLIWLIFDANGKEIKRMSSSASKGLNKLTWNLRTNSTNPINSGGNGFLVSPGNYSLSVTLVKNDAVETLVEKQQFVVKGLNNQTLLAKNPAELTAFRSEVAELNRKVSGVGRVLRETNEILTLLQDAITNYPNADLSLLKEVKALKISYDECSLLLWGDRLRSKHEFETAPSLSDRLNMVEYQLYENTAGVSNTHKANKAIAEEEYAALRVKLNDMIQRMEALEAKLATVPIPYTKSRGLDWKRD